MLTIAEAEGNKSWQEAVGDIQLAINTAPHRITKYSPLELMFGRVSRPRNLIVADVNDTNIPEIDLEQIRTHASERIEKSASYSKSQFDKGKAKVKRFEIGNSVLLKNEERNQTKLDPKYKGPFKIKQILKNDRYEIVSSDGRRTYKYPHDRMRLVPDLAENNPQIILSDVEDDESDE